MGIHLHPSFLGVAALGCGFFVQKWSLIREKKDLSCSVLWPSEIWLQFPEPQGRELWWLSILLLFMSVPNKYLISLYFRLLWSHISSLTPNATHGSKLSHKHCQNFIPYIILDTVLLTVSIYVCAIILTMSNNIIDRCRSPETLSHYSRSTNGQWGSWAKELCRITGKSMKC